MPLGQVWSWLSLGGWEGDSKDTALGDTLLSLKVRFLPKIRVFGFSALTNGPISSILYSLPSLVGGFIGWWDAQGESPQGLLPVCKSEKNCLSY